MNNFKGAFYIDRQRMADFSVQIEMGCDPEVLRMFSDSMILKGSHPDLTVAVIEMDEFSWRQTEKMWRSKERFTRETSPLFH